MKTTKQSEQVGEASLRWDGESLEVRHGAFTRRWRLTQTGMATEYVASGERLWVEREASPRACDWHLFRLAPGRGEARLTGTVIERTREPFTQTERLRATVDFTYPEAELDLRYIVELFPEAAGTRTQLAVRATRPMGTEDLPSYLLQSYGESLALDPAACGRRAAGYYNDPQHRNHDLTPILRQDAREGALCERTREIYDWANLLTLERDGGGLTLLKESHKCVNQSGIDTGAFVLTPDGVLVTGLGLKDNNYQRKRMWLPHEHFRSAWATWCVPFDGGEAERQLSLKRFDRARFQPKPEAGAHSRSNTWGSRAPGIEARGAANETDVLKEIESCADLGIDAVAIDDGWQVDWNGQVPEGAEWWPHPERFPTGWRNLRAAATEAGVDLILWLPGRPVPLERMVANVEQGGFTGLKLDFLGFPTRDVLDDVLEKARRLQAHFDHRLDISWDVTEETARLGYYFGREYGSLHIANRKGTYDSERVHHIAYTPRLVLRDAWHLAHYLNLNQIEITITDPATVDPAISDAARHSHAYCTAMTVAGLPLFFQETHFLEGQAREETRSIMRVWREHREAMARTFKFPIGDEPGGASWTGFQCHDPETGSGYVLLFRELHAAPETHAPTLHFVDPAEVRWTELTGGEAPVLEEGKLVCAIKEAPGFRWLRYEQPGTKNP